MMWTTLFKNGARSTRTIGLPGLLTLLPALLLISCGGGNEDESAASGNNCIRSLDCAGSRVCIDGICLESDGDQDLDDAGGDEEDCDCEAESEFEEPEEPEAPESDDECGVEGRYPSAATRDAYGLEWLEIPGGCFVMGCAPDDGNCLEREKPRHRVRVKAFRMNAAEISQDQYFALTGKRPSLNDRRGGNYPVERVSWNDAVAFCRAVGGRLPSEAEWEYAARAGTRTIFYCGDDETCLAETAWYEANSEDHTQPVAVKEANAFGLYDMMGNVLEWVEDCIHDDYNGAPDNASAWVDGSCSLRVLRGGSCFYLARGLRLSNRMWSSPAFSHSHFTGFRCAADID